MAILTGKPQQPGMCRGEEVSRMTMDQQQHFQNTPSGSNGADLDPPSTSADSTECAAASDDQLVNKDTSTNTAPLSSEGSQLKSPSQTLRRLIDNSPIVKLLHKIPSQEPSLDLDEHEKPSSSVSEQQDSRSFIIKLLPRLSGHDAHAPDIPQSSGSSQEAEDKASSFLNRMFPNTKLTRFAEAHLPLRSLSSSPTSSRAGSLATCSDPTTLQEAAEAEEMPLPSRTSSAREVAAPMRSSRLLGYWKLQANENWETLLKEAGMGVLLRRISQEMTTFEHISVLGDQWHIRMLSPLKNFENLFRLDEEFEEENFDGRRVKAVASLDEGGSRLTIRQSALESEGLQLDITRQLLPDDRLMQTVTCQNSGTTARRYFVRISPDQLP